MANEGNLVDGFKFGQGILQGNVYGLATVARGLKKAERETVKSLQGKNLTWQRKLAEAGREYLYADILRPEERGLRSGSRMTGKFKFGARGSGAFKGFPVSDRKSGQYGFGWPHVPTADARTEYVWRTLEYGLTGTRHSKLHGGILKMENPLGLLRPYGTEFPSVQPEATHIVPKAFTFRPWEPERSGQLILRRRGKSNLFGSRTNKETGEKALRENIIVRRDRQGGGVPAKHFLERAWAAVLPKMIPDYLAIPRQTFEKLK